MKIINGLVFGPDHKMHERDLCFENGVITAESDGETFDASGCYVLPGFIDTHIHGAYGVEFAMSDKDMTPALDWLTEQGVTSILATLETETPEELMADAKKIAALDDDRVLGIHAEGPFVNPVRKGGMLPDRIQLPAKEIPEQIQKYSGGRLRLLSMAPELAGVDEVLKACLAMGVKVSMAHSDADYETAKRAVDKGFSRSTHTYNAMRGLNHREPAILGCALTDDRVMCELICDLHHVSAPAIQIVLRCKGPENITMISDSSFFAGIPEGEYNMMDRKLFVKDGFCKLEDGTICGSATTLAQGAKNMFALGCKPENIAVMACVNPAKAAGSTDRGELKEGMRADIVVLDEHFAVQAVFSAGKRVR